LAHEDQLRLFDFLLDRAKPRRASMPRSSPFVCRKAGDSPFLRELLIPFRGAGYVALYEIKDAVHVTVLAVRHQLEDDYH
jgi:hypothetical protein